MSGIPLVLLTGFLGSGKTTLLNRLLTDPALARSAVLVNEVGERGLDHHLVFEPRRGDDDACATREAARAQAQAMLLLQGGCVCCTVRDDLSVALDALAARRDRGEVPAFERVIVETTGIAHPSPIITALRDPASRFELAAIVCTVDAVGGLERLTQRPECLAQVVLADTLVVTRCDLSTADRIEGLEARLRALNPRADLVRADDTGLDRAIALQASSDRIASALREVPAPGSPTMLGASGLIRPLGHAGIDIDTIRFSGPAVWGGALARIGALAASLDDRLLRVKGVLRLEGCEQPMVVQWAGGRVSPLVALPNGLEEGVGSPGTELEFAL